MLVGGGADKEYQSESTKVRKGGALQVERELEEAEARRREQEEIKEIRRKQQFKVRPLQLSEQL
jgi:hypothetical protein